MIRPDYLEIGDTVVLVSPAGKINKENVLPTISLLESWGLHVVVDNYSFDEDYRFASSIKNRLEAMQKALDNKKCKAILCNRGGYGCIHLIDKLKFDEFYKYPKWIIGFSDITVFHSFINKKLLCETLHAPMSINLSVKDIPKETLRYFNKAIFGKSINYSLKTNHHNRIGKSEGELIGGNLATFCNLLGTGIDYDFKDKILFIEDVGEPIHKIDQMLTALKIAGKLAEIKGLIVGGFTDIENEPNFGKSLNKIITEHVSTYHYPVIFDFPAGHISHNYPLYFGRKVILEVSTENVLISF